MPLNSWDWELGTARTYYISNCSEHFQDYLLSGPSLFLIAFTTLFERAAFKQKFHLMLDAKNINMCVSENLILLNRLITRAPLATL